MDFLNGMSSTDWRDLSTAEITKRVADKVGSGSIMLFHNVGEYTPKGLPEILRYLNQVREYEIVPISEHSIDHEGGATRGGVRLKS